MGVALTRASARADSASWDCRRIFSVSSGLMGGLAAVCAGRGEGAATDERSGVAPYRWGEGSREVPVLRGMPDRRRAALRPTWRVGVWSGHRKEV